jgi:hypothetical protein
MIGGLSSRCPRPRPSAPRAPRAHCRRRWRLRRLLRRPSRARVATRGERGRLRQSHVHVSRRDRRALSRARPRLREAHDRGGGPLLPGADVGALAARTRRSIDRVCIRQGRRRPAPHRVSHARRIARHRRDRPRRRRHRHPHARRRSRPRNPHRRHHEPRRRRRDRRSGEDGRLPRLRGSTRTTASATRSSSRTSPRSPSTAATTASGRSASDKKKGASTSTSSRRRTARRPRGRASSTRRSPTRCAAASAITTPSSGRAGARSSSIRS